MYRKRKFVRKPRRQYRRRGRGSLALRAYKLARSAKKDEEVKGGEVAQVTSAVGTTAIIEPLTLSSEGDDNSNREGHFVNGKYILIRGIVEKNASSTYTYCRIILFKDMVSNGTVPGVSELLDTSVGTVHAAPLNKSYTHRFRVLLDRRYALNSTVPNIAWKMYKRIPWKMTYNTASATQAALQTGHVYLLRVTNEATNTATVNFTSRFCWTG